MGKIIYINSACNQKCVFCLARYRKTIFSALKLPALSKGERLVISGGETTLSPDVFKILALTRKNKINNVELQTNAVTLADFDFCRKLFNSGVKEFNVNMPAHSEKLNDRITAAPGSFKKRLTGLKNLIRLGAYIRLTFVINKFNYTRMRDYCYFVKHNLPQVKLLAFHFVQIEGAVKNNTALVPKFQKVRPYLLAACRYAQKARLNLITDNIPLCIFGGKKYFCFSVDYRKTKLRKNTAQAEKTLNLKKNFILTCNKCVYKHKCGGIRSDYLELYGEGEFKPFHKR